MSKSDSKVGLDAPREANARTGSSSATSDTPVETATNDLQNSMLGEFRLLRRLGKGGMAEVYLAEQTSLNRNVAIKVLRKDLVTDETYLKRFKTEAMAAGGLSHPNIVQVYAIGEENSVHYIVQEYVQGQNLREFLARKGPPESAVAVHLMKQAAAALQAAGEAGIVHRDIKPENLMITRKGEVKVADFGLAQLTQKGERVNLTQVGITMGTPLYMSPEQVKGSKLDQRSDIYSLGVTFYHLLTGSPPFRGENALAIAMQHVSHDAEPLEQLRPDLPAALCKVVHKMMAKDRDARYAAAGAIIKDLKKASHDKSGGDAVLDEPAATAEFADFSPLLQPHNGVLNTFVTAAIRTADRPAKRQVPLFVLALVVIAACAAGLGWMMRTRDPFSAPLPRGSQVVKKATADEQLFFALERIDDEDAYRAVIRYFPDPEASLTRARAEQKLVMLYLQQRRYDDAFKLCKELAVRSEKEFRLFGLAGQLVIHNRRSEYHQAQDILEQLGPKSQWLNLDDRTMLEYLEEAIQDMQKAKTSSQSSAKTG